MEGYQWKSNSTRTPPPLNSPSPISPRHVHHRQQATRSHCPGAPASTPTPSLGPKWARRHRGLWRLQPFFLATKQAQGMATTSATAANDVAAPPCTRHKHPGRPHLRTGPNITHIPIPWKAVTSVQNQATMQQRVVTDSQSNVETVAF